MRSSIILFALLTVCSAETHNIRGPVLDGIIKNVLEGLREKAKDINIPELNHVINDPLANLTLRLEKGIVKGVEKFQINKIRTSLIPLSVTNLTITLDNVTVSGIYDIDGILRILSLPEDINVFGNGNCSATLRGLFLTIAANFEWVNGKLQITKNGLHGFDVYLRESEIELENLFGGGESGNVLNKFLGQLLPEVVRDYKFIAFETAKGYIIQMINQYLASS